MKKIKVCMIIGNAVRGGVESYVFSYCSKPSNIYDFTFVIFDDSKFIPEDEINLVNGHLVLVPNIKKLFAFNRALRTLFKSDAFDIVHSHLNTLSGFPLRIAKKCNIPIRIAQAHAGSNKKEFLRNALKILLKRSSKRYATNLTAVSKEAALFQFGAKDLSRCEVIPPYIDVSKFRFNVEKREKIRKELNIKENDYVLGNVGRLCKTKNQLFIVDIIASLNKTDNTFKVVLIGEGNLKDKIMTYARSKKVENNIIIIPAVSNIWDYYNVFDIFVLPSLYEGYGLVIPESQANGLKFVCSTNIPTARFDNYDGVFIDLEIKKWTNELKNKPSRTTCNFILNDNSISQKNCLFDYYEQLLNNKRIEK